MTPSSHHQGATGQDRVLDFLGKPSGGHDTQRVDTHGSIVFLWPDRVYKIKRAVRLPYLDYSSLDKRKHACEEEIAVNRRFAPDIYRGVVPITEGETGPEINGKGDVIEWAVEMARFDENQTLDHLAARGEITPGLAEPLAEALAASHHSAPVSDGQTWLASLPSLIEHNTTAFRGHAALASADVERLHVLSCDRLAENQALLKHRAAARMVRRCHGDAHLGNIVMIDGKPRLFDAIEFDPVIATTDVLYDFAFPLMDLLHFGNRAAANRLLNFYLQATWRQNAGALALLPLFLSIRAAIRANVLLTKHAQGAGAAALSDAQSYFGLALDLTAPGKPSLIAIGGRSGTGKSVLARAISGLVQPAPGAVLLRSDVIRKEIFGVDPLVKLPEAAYAPGTSERVYGEMLDRARCVLAQGLSAVVDAAFLKQDERNQLRPLTASCGVDFFGIFLVAETSVRLARIGARRNDASDANQDVALFQERIDTGVIDWAIVDASGTPEETLERSVRHLPRDATREHRSDR
ncbi:bifunctional aminoglycoside phosphotransferase/ATP-binding protein [Bradyrhizobium cenepequi]|uniref:bifunctional aminoglycoside phosphotransferase/ATP-binding protein n=1 Tax=Bradyrhizobium cenepequi TaxID=2821403 RepID=UPI001CE35243|nr:bifunctional aminoglycoside phosphotransferase/ATP-binding protein [Bradyrhizobium cenepequi]MCA6106297.1 AAA family ATPase [Bradyrhizobium cenepequi]